MAERADAAYPLASVEGWTHVLGDGIVHQEDHDQWKDYDADGGGWGSCTNRVYASLLTHEHAGDNFDEVRFVGDEC